MANLPYIESLRKNRKKFSLYEWVKKDPKKHIQDIYFGKPPDLLLTRADRFRAWFWEYPGDGVLFFHDDLLSPLSEVIGSTYYAHPDKYNLFFNYLYSYRSNFTYKSKGALAVFLLNCPSLAIPLYKYRKNFDTKAFTEMIGKLNVFNSFNEYTEGDNAKYITQFIWGTILSHKVTLNVCDNKIFMHLYHAYTYTAIQRFFFLSNSRAALKDHINNAYSIYRQTYLLLNCWSERIPRLNVDPNRRVPQMSSIKAMERFHDLKAEEILEEQRILETGRHVWVNLSKKICKISPEWYIPEFSSDIRLRGQQHRNCVGSYIERHFKKFEYDSKKTYDYKMLLLFTDSCEAEVHIKFDEVVVEGKAYIGCVDVKIQQAKTAYNNDIPKEDYLELKKIVKEFKNIPVEDFNPITEEYTHG